jgi:hypothetical protein
MRVSRESKNTKIDGNPMTFFLFHANPPLRRRYPITYNIRFPHFCPQKKKKKNKML